MALAMGTLLSVLLGTAAVALIHVSDRAAVERRRGRRARAIRVGWMPLDPSVEEIKLRIICESVFDR
jgi:hypothetical protein